MDYEILYPGSNTMLRVNLKPGESLKAESGAMVAMSDTIDVEGKLEGGLLGGLGRMLSGEKFFFQTLKAKRGAGEVLLSPAALGTLHAIELDGLTGYIVQKDGFFAGSNEVNVNTSMQNLSKGLFSGEGFFILKISGSGTLFVSSFGTIHPLALAPGQEIVVDNEHLVAWPEDLSYSIEKASGGWISSFTSGEGLVCRFRGPGTVFIQTRNPSGFGAWVRRFVPSGSSISSCSSS
ncbi:MAG: TIGR00266 family protein [Gammaproteobacteria bacterium]|nr:TIGR00266 family protein [Gammaproteobacteria bacterium]